MSNWNAPDPGTATWYGEVLFEMPDGTRNYNFAYSNDTSKPYAHDIDRPAFSIVTDYVVLPVEEARTWMADELTAQAQEWGMT